MPITPANALFAQTGIGDNPILGALNFLSQRRQDTIDRQQRDEQLALENERAEQEFQLRKEAQQLQREQIQAALDARDIAERQAQFEFKTGATNIPQAILQETLPTDQQIISPEMDALSQLARGQSQGSFADEEIGQTFVTDPASGNPVAVSAEYIARVQQAEQEEFERSIALPIAQMQQRERQAVASLLQREALAKQTQAFRERQQNWREQMDRSRLELQKKKVAGVSLGRVSNLDAFVANGIRLDQGSLQDNQELVDHLSGTDKNIFAGRVAAKEVMGKDEFGQFINKADRLGWKIPTFDPADVNKYTTQQGTLKEVIGLANQFNELASDPSFRAAGELNAVTAKQFNHPSWGVFQSMDARLTKLKEVVGESGVLTNQDVDRLRGLLPQYGDSSAIRAQKVKQFTEAIRAKERDFFKALPQSQRQFVYQMNGLDTSFINEGPGSKLKQDIANLDGSKF